MKSRVVSLLLLAVVIVLAVIGWLKRSPDEVEPSPTVLAAGSVFDANSPSAPSDEGASPSPASSPAPADSSASVPDPVFQDWFENEAKSMNAPRVDSAQKRRQIEARLAQLTPAQARQLLITALDTAATASERILSVYLLVEGGSKTQSEVEALLQAPLVDHGPSTPHSVAENRNAQERSMRLMALDGLAARAAEDSKAMAALEAAASSAADRLIREHAKRRLAEVRAH